MTTSARPLFDNGPLVSAIGMGTWATGGPSSAGDQPLGWGSNWDRDEAAAVLRSAFDAGITLFDTADAYGSGTAERLIGDALGSVREEIAIVSKWGNLIDETSRQLVGSNSSQNYIRTALEASLDRLRTDHLDLYLLHLSGLAIDEASELVGTLSELVDEGKIGAFGWSTDELDRAQAWLGQPGFRAIEFEANVVHDAPDMFDLCATSGLTALIRGPLGTGLLSGRYPAGSQIEDKADFRRLSPDWLNYFQNGQPVESYARRLEAVTDILSSNGRTVAQGALCWLLARSESAFPIPGAQNREQALQNAAAAQHGPLSTDEMTAIENVLADLEHT